MQINIPFSKDLAKNFLVPFPAILIFSQIFFHNDKATLLQPKQQVFALFAMTAILPIIYAGINQNKHFHFKIIKKFPEKDRLFSLPFSQSFASFLFAVVNLAMGYAISRLINNGIHLTPILTLLLSAALLVSIVIAHEHPKIGFSNTSDT